MKRLLALLAFSLAASTLAFAAPPPVTLRTVVAGGLASPVEIAHAGDGSGRLFVVEQAGRIRVVKNGSLLTTPFLDITSLALFDFGERGLLGLAFHPQYAANRKFYVFYTREGDGALRVSEFLASAANPDIADPGSERPIITIPHSAFGNHNGGRIAFGPEGYLYIATGDGGGGDDPGENAENINSLLGKLLRIDVNTAGTYLIPPGNPFVGVAGADEIWAYGLRNPWRFSFDRMTGDLFIADVGQDRREEVNFEPAGSSGGRNYGWDVMEGSLCNEPASCNPAGKVLPILEHARADGWRSVIGGYVYRGRKSAGLRGFYIYGDFFVRKLRAASPNGDGSWSTFELVDGPDNVTAFGEDEAGELYMVNYNNGSLHAIDGPDDPVPPFKRGDLDADGRADVLWRNSLSGDNYLYLMQGINVASGGYLPTVADLDWQIVGTGDFGGDGRADILWRNSSTGENYMYLMNGLSVVSGGYLPTVADQNWQVAGTGDFNGDGKDDVLWRNSSTGQNYVYLMNGFSVANEGYLPRVADTNWQVKGVADFNGDGRADILWRNATSGQNYLYLMQGMTVASEGDLPTVADTNWQIKGVGDFDGDGRADIFWRNASTGQNYVYLMQGISIAAEGHLTTVADLSWQIAAVGDYDGDGKSDILWRNASTGENYLYPMDGISVKPSEGFLPSVSDLNWKVVP